MSGSSEGSGYEVHREVFEDGDEIVAPDEAEMLHVGRINEGLEVWFRVDTSEPESYHFSVQG